MTRFAQDDRRHALWLTIAAIGLVLAANHIGARRTAIGGRGPPAALGHDDSERDDGRECRHRIDGRGHRRSL